MIRIACVALALAAFAAPALAQTQKGSTVSTVSPDVLKDLAPTGTLRASINLGNIVLAQGTPDNPSGVTPELARELGKRLGVPVSLTCFDAAVRRNAFDRALRTSLASGALASLRATLVNRARMSTAAEPQ